MARSTWLHGCVRIAVQSTKLKDGGVPAEVVWIDEPQLEVLVAKVSEPKPSGGPQPSPQRSADATR